MQRNEREFNSQIAKIILSVIDKKFPLGGINREDVAKKLSEEILVSQLAYLSQLRLAYESKFDSIKIESILAMLKGGYCGDLSFFSMLVINKNFAGTNAEIVNLKQHSFIVIGRPAASNPDDINTWGKDAIICDPWAKTIFPACEFHAFRKTAANIRFFVQDYKTVLPGHYLDGEPKVLTSNKK